MLCAGVWSSSGRENIGKLLTFHNTGPLTFSSDFFSKQIKSSTCVHPPNSWPCLLKELTGNPNPPWPLFWSAVQNLFRLCSTDDLLQSSQRNLGVECAAHTQPEESSGVTGERASKLKAWVEDEPDGLPGKEPARCTCLGYFPSELRNQRGDSHWRTVSCDWLSQSHMQNAKHRLGIRTVL